MATRIEIPEDAPEQLRDQLRVQQIELEMQAEELRRARDDLEASRDKYRELFDFAPVGYVTLDATGAILETNVTAEALLGLDRVRLLGRSLARFILSADIPHFHQHQRAVRETASRQVCDVRVARSDGSVIEVQIESAAAVGEPGNSRSVLIDVTQRKLAERSAVEGTERLARMNRVLVAEMSERERVQRKLDDREAVRRETELALDRERGFADRLIEAAPALVLVLGSDGRVQRFNSYMSDVTGYALQEVAGEDWCATFVPESARAPAREAIARVAAGTANLRPHVTPIVTRSGAVREIEWSHTTFESDAGDIIGIVAIGQDITDRKRIEQDIRQAHKMEAVGVLASGVAHDFNNVLMGIIGCADLALNRLSHQDHAWSYVEQMKAAALGGASVINRLMAFARRQQTERKVLDLNSLVARMDTMLRHLLGEDIELCTALTAVNAAISCQPDEIEQLVMNLSVNARHAMPKGGRLTLSTLEVEFVEDGEQRPTGLGEGSYVVLEVVDTGSGMDELTRRRIFEPFFTTKQSGSGTGLGLSMVYATVQEHAGQIDVESAPGLGSRFSIYFPQSTEPPTRPSVAPDAPLGAQSGGETVLLVEDEPLVRLSVSHYLERHGYRVLEATSERDVLRILDEHAGPIDVLLSDTVLPGLSGPEIAPVVRAARPDVRVVYMSAHPNETLVAEGRIPPGTPTLQKPFTESALVSRIRQALSDYVHIPGPARISLELGLRPDRPRLLLVEDQDAARDASRELLEELGYEVSAVASGGAALAACRDAGEAFDVIVTDVGLPDFSGVEVARRIRLLFHGVGIIFLSGRFGDDIALSEMLDEANTAFVQKPVEMARLARTIESVLAASHRGRSMRA
jgi:PAS domain S-box-containing protein